MKCSLPLKLGALVLSVFIIFNLISFAGKLKEKQEVLKDQYRESKSEYISLNKALNQLALQETQVKKRLSKIQEDLASARSQSEQMTAEIKSITDDQSWVTERNLPYADKRSEPEFVMIVPFRTTQNEQKYIFETFMNTYFSQHDLKGVICFVSQWNSTSINRGMLINYAFQNIVQLYPNIRYIITHELDRLPENDQADFGPGTLRGLIDVKDSGLSQPVLKIETKLFESINGFSNCFEGTSDSIDMNMYLRILALNDPKYTSLIKSKKSSNLNHTSILPHDDYPFFHVCPFPDKNLEDKHGRQFNKLISEGVMDSQFFQRDGLSTISEETIEPVATFYTHTSVTYYVKILQTVTDCVRRYKHQ